MNRQNSDDNPSMDDDDDDESVNPAQNDLDDEEEMDQDDEVSFGIIDNARPFYISKNSLVEHTV